MTPTEIDKELRDPETRWCPAALAHPRSDDQKILLYVPGAVGPVRVRFGDIWWTEVEE